jgi:N-acetylneuraminic acid mutarotase
MYLRDISVLVLPIVLLASSLASGQEDTWETRSDIPTSRVLHATCTAAGKIYMFGGQRMGGGSGIMSVEEYDPATDSWRSRADMPTARLGMTASVVNDKCYVIGGSTAPGRAGLNRVDEYDPVTNSWRQRADMPTARTVGASAVMNGRIYVAGGWVFATIFSGTVASLEIYDPTSNTWTSGADMPTARAILAASAAKEDLFFIGGGSVALGTLDSSVVESYNPTTNTWTRRADMPTPRGALTVTMANGLIYAIGGGFNVVHLARVEVYDPLKDAWSERTSMPTARWGVTSGLIGRKIYVFGGSTGRGVGHNSLSNNEAYTTKSFGINAAINDAWVSADAPLQGFFFTVFPDSGFFFLSWFTFDALIPIGDDTAVFGADDQRWVSGGDFYSGNSVTVSVELTSGGIFNGSIPLSTQGPGYGTITITFINCSEALLTYDFPSVGLSGQMTLTRVLPDNVALCLALADP